MRKLYLTLFVLNLISLLTILQIVFNVFPLIPSNYTAEQVDRINNLVISLGVAVMTSTFFYYLLVYIPEKRKEKVIRSMISINILRIANRLLIVLAYLADLCSIKSNCSIFSDINPEHFKAKISPIYPNEETAYIKCQLEYSSQNYYIENISLKSIVDSNYRDIETELKYIFENPTIIFENQKLVKALSDIKNSSFFFITKANVKYNHRQISFFELENLYRSYLTLLKFTKPSPISFKRATQEDINNYS